MKEKYFEPDTIQELSNEWLETYGKPDKNLNQPFDIHQAGLLILDMQEYFLDENSHAFVPSGLAVLTKLKNIAEKFRIAGRPVIATQHINSIENAAMMKSWWSDIITESHPLVNLHPELNIQPEEVLKKSQYDAFYESDLASVLAMKDIHQLVIGGVMTHLCCETTARSAFVRGLEVFFLVDGTATYNRDYHQGTLRNLAHGVAVLSTTDQIINAK